MKPRSSCELCHQRRRKCVVRPGAKRCNGCEDADKACQFTPKYRFRNTESTSYRTPNYASPQLDQDLPPVLDNTTQVSTGPKVPLDDKTEGDATIHDISSNVSTRDGRDPSETEEGCTVETFFPSLKTPSATAVTSIAYLLDNSPADSLESPIQHTICDQSRPTRYTPVSFPIPTQKPLPSTRLTGREAYLMRLYILKLAPSVSRPDPSLVRLRITTY
jgi:hypothetical protein